MKRYRTYLFGSFLILLLLFGCVDDGAQGPAGPPGGSAGPLPIKVLIAASDNATDLEDLAMRCVSSGIFPMGTEVYYINVVDSVPPVGVFGAYDAVLVYSNTPFSYADSLGDVLADYVDAGGGVVVCIAALAAGWELEGRIMDSPGYCPFQAAGPAASPSGQLDPSSIDVPAHPIFNGTDVFNFTYWFSMQAPDPPLNPGGVLLATDMNGNKRVALNTDESVAGIGIFFPLQFWDGATSYPSAMQLFANACLVVADAIPSP